MIKIGQSTLTLSDVFDISNGSVSVSIAASSHARIEAARNMVLSAIERDERIYGVTTGFGALADYRIDSTTARELQHNLLRSHASGVGDPLPANVVRAMLVLRAHALAHGYSGVRPILIKRLLDLYHHDILPVVPSQGSVGASGDLAPLAHLSLPLTGEGHIVMRGERMLAGIALERASIEALVLEPKEALALINGTQAITALSALSLHSCWNIVRAALGAGALTLVARSGRVDPFSELIQNVRPHSGQLQAARYLRTLLDGWIDQTGVERPVQDRYSLRAMPQVIGAVIETVRFATGVVETEINSVTDNPLFFVDDDQILSGANFHGHPVALASDHAKTAMASLATFGERRISSLVDPRASDVPAFLSSEPGINSGLMIPHYVAASIVSENKVLAHPASVDSISTSADVEDYNSMGTLAARNLMRVVENTSKVTAIELICAAQAVDLRKIDPGNEPVFEIYRNVRQHVPFLEKDRYGLSAWIETLALAVREGAFNGQGESLIRSDSEEE
jgi:histidine ammonia-lyase